MAASIHDRRALCKIPGAMDTATKIKLMIVDDNAEIRRRIRELLEPFAGTVCECDSGEAAVRRCERFKPDFVTMDVNMKELNGLYATRMILERQPATEIVIVTLADSELLRHAAAEAGATGFFLKQNPAALLHHFEKRLVFRTETDLDDTGSPS